MGQIFFLACQHTQKPPKKTLFKASHLSQSSLLEYPFFCFSHLAQKQASQMARHPAFFHTYSTDCVSVFIFLPSAIVIFTFVYFFLTNVAIVRARVYDYSSIYDMVTSVICFHITPDTCYRTNFLWQYRAIFLFLFNQKTFFIYGDQTTEDAFFSITFITFILRFIAKIYVIHCMHTRCNRRKISPNIPNKRNLSYPSGL